MPNDQIGASNDRGLVRRVLVATCRALSATHPCVFAPWAVGIAAWPLAETAPGLHAQLHAAVFGPALGAGDQFGAGMHPTDTALAGAGSNTDQEDDDA